jgi:hypothetical protein
VLWLPGRKVPLCCGYLGERFLCAVATWEKGSFMLWLPGRKVPLCCSYLGERFRDLELLLDPFYQI